MFAKFFRHLNQKKLTNPQYNYLFDPYEGDEFVCFDCETTGLNPKSDEIISIGAIKIKGNTILASAKFERLVKPKNLKLDSENIKIHRIRECDLENAPSMDSVLYEFLDFVGNRPLVGYYLEFDVAMINKYTKKMIGIKLPNIQHEVSAIYYDKKIGTIPQGNIDLRFDTIMKNLGLPFMGKHDALNDAIMTAMIFIKLRS